MINAGNIMADNAGLWSHLRRMPFVVMLTLGLMLSMIHCAGCGMAFAGTHDVTISHGSGDAPDVPDQQLPSHSGHCLSHVTAQVPATVNSPADINPQTLVIAGDPIPAASDGLPLFKPPRI